MRTNLVDLWNPTLKRQKEEAEGRREDREFKTRLEYSEFHANLDQITRPCQKKKKIHPTFMIRRLSKLWHMYTLEYVCRSALRESNCYIR